jgi:hypothetical protein
LLRGGALQNTGIHLERNRIASNGTHCAEASLGGIVVQAGNPGTVIINNLIHDNLGDGVGIGEGRLNARGEPQRDGAPGTQTLLVQNTIHRNGWNGVSIIAPELPMLVNNAITSNGVDDAAAGGRAGVLLRGWYAPDGERVSLYNNLLCDNRLGEAGAHVFSGDHADNRTPTGAEGAGLVATPECASPGGVYESLAGADAIPGTLDDDFTLLQPGTGHLPSPAIDRGADPFALGLDLHFDASLYRADFEVPDTRPKQRDIGRPLDYDIGALELPCDCPNLCFGRCRMVIEGGSSSRDTCERSTFWDPDEECCDSSTGNTTPTNPPAMDNCPSNRYPIPGFEETRTDGCSRGNPLNPNNPTDPSELCGAHFRFGSSDIADPLPCNGHDVCYATCNTTQGQCDSAFLHDMFAVCEQPVSGPCALLVEDCLGWAESYAAAVAGFGEEGWIMGQNRSCQCCETR